MNISRCHSDLLSEFFRFHDLLGIYINVYSASSTGRPVFHSSNATYIHLPLEGLDLWLYSSIDGDWKLSRKLQRIRTVSVDGFRFQCSTLSLCTTLPLWLRLHHFSPLGFTASLDKRLFIGTVADQEPTLFVTGGKGIMVYDFVFYHL